MENPKSEIPASNPFAPYTPIKRIAKGGMGEIYLVHDPICSRDIALKKIRPDLIHKEVIRKRFLQEARLMAHLHHPSILPIYSIHDDPENLYYTMPYIEGVTLKDLLKEAKKIAPQETSETSLNNLIRIFLKVCEGIAYAHSQKILHRDLKPENIMVGKYGEVFILDWGIGETKELLEIDSHPLLDSQDLTLPGKIAGTVSYLAPERAQGLEASEASDIYSLGVMLYYILTLKLPFERKNIKEFRKNYKEEKLIPPKDNVENKDLPPLLNQICIKCLEPSVEKRYKNMQELLHDLQVYIAGNPEWVFYTTLHHKNSLHWQYQENILLAKFVALTQKSVVSNWFHIMISKASFMGNLLLKTTLKLEKDSKGIGFLLNTSSLEPEKGYCLWIGPFCHLYRSQVLVQEIKDFTLPIGKEIDIAIEKINSSITLYINNQKILFYTAHLPLMGDQIGLMYKDENFTLFPLQIYSRSMQTEVSCLAIPDSFFAKKLYDYAIDEYEKIALSFAGRQESRIALFHEGLSYIEKGKQDNNQETILKAFVPFEKLHDTASAPLEYLGKALIYEALDDLEEEAKCLELALRKFSDHPDIKSIEEHILIRSHETALTNRKAAYQLLLIGLRFLPDFTHNMDTVQLLNSLQKNLQIFFFIPVPDTLSNEFLSLELAYHLHQDKILFEMFENSLKYFTQNSDGSLPELFYDYSLALVDLDAKEKTLSLIEKLSIPSTHLIYKIFKPLETQAQDFFKPLDEKESLILTFLMRKSLDEHDFKTFPLLFTRTRIHPKYREIFDELHCEYLLYTNDQEQAQKILSHYPSAIDSEETPWFFYDFCLHPEKIKKMPILESSYPSPYSLLIRYLRKLLPAGWFKKALFWEKRELIRQKNLYIHITGDKYLEKSLQEYLP
jgi:serine/threonine-protein kinase